jgi:ABC-type glutathione transport system ATPase component
MSPFNAEVVGTSLIYMVIESVAYFCLALCIEYDYIIGSLRRAWKKLRGCCTSDNNINGKNKTVGGMNARLIRHNLGSFSGDSTVPTGESDNDVDVEDEDVARERQRDKSGDVLAVTDLTKTYASRGKKKNKKKKQKKKHSGDDSDDNDDDGDARKIAAAAAQEGPNGFTAVDRVSLGIPFGECFGLLGHNGAG